MRAVEPGGAPRSTSAPVPRPGPVSSSGYPPGSLEHRVFVLEDQVRRLAGMLAALGKVAESAPLAMAIANGSER